MVKNTSYGLQRMRSSLWCSWFLKGKLYPFQVLQQSYASCANYETNNSAYPLAYFPLDKLLSDKQLKGSAFPLSRHSWIPVYWLSRSACPQNCLWLIVTNGPQIPRSPHSFLPILSSTSNGFLGLSSQNQTKPVPKLLACLVFMLQAPGQWGRDGLQTSCSWVVIVTFLNNLLSSRGREGQKENPLQWKLGLSLRGTLHVLTPGPTLLSKTHQSCLPCTAGQM